MNDHSILRTVARHALVMSGVVALAVAAGGCSQARCGTNCIDQATGKCTGKCSAKCCAAAKTAAAGGKRNADCECPGCSCGSKTTAVNTRCPISGEPIDPTVTTVTDGKKVAFCCAGCIGKWKRMSAAERARLLAAAK